MNFRKFVDCLTTEEFVLLQSAVWEHSRDLAEEQAKGVALSDFEVGLAKVGEKVKAITELRARIGCNLHCAKIVVERFLSEVGKK
jgi:ribosomal protein L7/L12